MLILSTDTSIGSASVCALKDGKVISSSEENEYSMQSETLFSHIENVMEGAKIEYEDIDYFCSTIGPGSFTGIRIGMTAFKIMAMSLKKPFIGITTLEAMAENAFDESLDGKITCMIKAGREQAYVQDFEISNQSINILSKAEAVDYKNLNSISESSDFIVTNFNDIASQYLNDKKLYSKNLSTNAIFTAKHLEKLINRADKSIKERTSPLYIRNADAKKANIKTKII